MAEKTKTVIHFRTLCGIVLLLMALAASAWRGPPAWGQSGSGSGPPKAGSPSGGENDWFVYLGNKAPPKAPPKQINAAEALPPLPLPATPLRRTERKKPPQPETLMGKVIWGESASFTDSTGDQVQIADWNLCPTDVERLLEKARETGLSYHWTNVNLSDFQLDPKTLPALIFSGARTLRLSDAHLQALRSYVLDGGTVICDSIAGSPFFYESAKQAFLQAFPECRWRVLPSDHPLYHMFVDVTRVSYPRPQGTNEPLLEGMYIGSRVGVLLSKYGLGCGWNRDTDRLAQIPKAAYYDIKSAGEIGVNLTAYLVGYADAAVVEARPEIYAAADQKPPTDEFVFAQLKHEGAWNVHPGAATNLLTMLRRHTTIRVNLKRIVVDPEKDDLTGYAFLYLTGLDDFSFAPRAVAALQQFLQAGGFLLVNNGLGLGTFDRAVRRELARILPEAKFQVLPDAHGLYSSLFKIEQVEYSPGLAQANPSLGSHPYLQAVFLGGDLRVLYSPYDLEAGWLPTSFPLLKGYEPASAERLGMNIIAYIMTH
ncbi:MAG: DUF4159 domain-containing protein [Planctomycetes bacterium]|jgi:hypothetical protein|nr:DUF4159 domain-containing protein [Planctomycetota bacterium]